MDQQLQKLRLVIRIFSSLCCCSIWIIVAYINVHVTYGWIFFLYDCELSESFFYEKKILLIRKTGVDGRNSHFWFSWCCLYPPWTNYASSDDGGGDGSNIESIKINGKWWWWSLILKPLFSRHFSIA